MQADAPFRAQPDDLGAVYVRSTQTREMIPLKSLIRVTNTVGPEQLERFNGFVAARVLGSGRPGVSSGEAIRAVEEVAAEALPEGYSIAWAGQAFQEKRTGRAIGDRLRPRHRHGVPDPRRALRALAAAVRGGDVGAVRGAGRARLRRARAAWRTTSTSRSAWWC